MPKLGAHVSVAGGLATAFDRMKKISGEVMQIFTRNQRQWQAKPLDEHEVEDFKAAFKKADKPFVASHASYLINLATWKEDLAERSTQSLVQELLRCSLLSIPWVVLHPGSHGGKGIDQGIKNCVANLDKAFELAGPKNRTGILLETVAGQGTGIGSDFKELAEIIRASAFSHRLGVCVDTCHIFSAGYDIRSPGAYRRTIDALSKDVGLERVKLFHLNDSKTELGSKVDRHEHIGKGKIGLKGFANLLNDTRFS
ncbi:MAG: deoxyribonuclease IV, partial [Thermodesulfobacteria bacterium]|nr:deoxyribonuclease IV [Thermodesulfobacteriota bacterium]